MGRLDIDQATNKDIADAVVSQIKWLRDLDEVTPDATLGGAANAAR